MGQGCAVAPGPVGPWAPGGPLGPLLLFYGIFFIVFKNILKIFLPAALI